MAIKVGGTTVIDDSRALSNIASVDAATVTALSTAGAGLPSQTGNTGKVLTTDGSAASWTEPGGGSYEVISNASYTNITTSTAPQFSFTQDKMHIVELFDVIVGNSNNGGIRPKLMYYNSSNLAQDVRWAVWQNQWASSQATYSPRRTGGDGSSASYFRLKIYQPDGKGFVMRGEGLQPKNGEPRDEVSGHAQINTVTNVSYIKVSPNAGTMNFRMRVLREA
jgi:hypothetical protein